MAQRQRSDMKVFDPLRGFDEYRRLTALVKSMAQEIERLNEDNLQLRAAILIYREVVQRRSAVGQHSTPPSLPVRE
jgi:hypothetical protein